MDKVDELREQLKNERLSRNTGDDTGNGSSITTRSTSEDIQRYTPNVDRETERGIQPVPGQSHGIVSAERAVDNAQGKSGDFFRSLAQSNNGNRSASRRPRKDNSQNKSDGTDVSESNRSGGTRRTVGNLVTDVLPPTRFKESEENDAQESIFNAGGSPANPYLKAKTATEKQEIQGDAPARKRGRPSGKRVPIIDERPTPTPEVQPKESLKEKVNKYIPQGQRLSEREARELEEPLIAALTSELEYLDKWLWSLNQDPLEQPVWSDLEEKDISRLTKVLLKTGQKSSAVATVSRSLVDLEDYITVGVIAAPRLKKSVEIVKQNRLRKRAENAQNDPRRERISRFRGRR